MTEALKYLVVDDAFRNQLNLSMSPDERSNILTDSAFLLRFDDQGNIIRVNDIDLEEKVCHEITYLTGSLNFLYEQACEDAAGIKVTTGGVPADTPCRQKVVRLMIDLLMGLSQIRSSGDAATVCSDIYHRKMQIRSIVLQKEN